MDVRITLSDGTVLESSSLIESDDRLFLYIRNGYGLREVFEKLIEPANTRTIQATQYGATTAKEGFTKLICVRDEGNGLITAVLKPHGI